MPTDETNRLNAESKQPDTAGVYSEKLQQPHIVFELSAERSKEIISKVLDENDSTYKSKYIKTDKDANKELFYVDFPRNMCIEGFPNNGVDNTKRPMKSEETLTQLFENNNIQEDQQVAYQEMIYLFAHQNSIVTFSAKEPIEKVMSHYIDKYRCEFVGSQVSFKFTPLLKSSPQKNILIKIDNSSKDLIIEYRTPSYIPENDPATQSLKIFPDNSCPPENCIFSSTLRFSYNDRSKQITPKFTSRPRFELGLLPATTPPNVELLDKDWNMSLQSLINIPITEANKEQMLELYRYSDLSQLNYMTINSTNIEDILTIIKKFITSAEKLTEAESNALQYFFCERLPNFTRIASSKERQRLITLLTQHQAYKNESVNSWIANFYNRVITSSQIKIKLIDNSQAKDYCYTFEDTLNSLLKTQEQQKVAAKEQTIISRSNQNIEAKHYHQAHTNKSNGNSNDCNNELYKRFDHCYHYTYNHLSRSQQHLLNVTVSKSILTLDQKQKIFNTAYSIKLANQTNREKALEKFDNVQLTGWKRTARWLVGKAASFFGKTRWKVLFANQFITDEDVSNSTNNSNSNITDLSKLEYTTETERQSKPTTHNNSNADTVIKKYYAKLRKKQLSRKRNKSEKLSPADEKANTAQQPKSQTTINKTSIIEIYAKSENNPFLKNDITENLKSEIKIAKNEIEKTWGIQEFNELLTGFVEEIKMVKAQTITGKLKALSSFNVKLKSLLEEKFQHVIAPNLTKRVEELIKINRKIIDLPEKESVALEVNGISKEINSDTLKINSNYKELLQSLLRTIEQSYDPSKPSKYQNNHVASYTASLFEYSPNNSDDERAPSIVTPEKNRRTTQNTGPTSNPSSKKDLTSSALFYNYRDDIARKLDNDFTDREQQIIDKHNIDQNSLTNTQNALR